jgi:hypothetical protein
MERCDNDGGIKGKTIVESDASKSAVVGNQPSAFSREMPP